MAFSEFIISGIKSGFRVGYKCNPTKLTPAKKNMQSAYAHPEVVLKQLTSDCLQGFMIGPLVPDDFPHIHVNRIGVIPKKAPGWEVAFNS